MGTKDPCNRVTMVTWMDSQLSSSQQKIVFHSGRTGGHGECCLKGVTFDRIFVDKFSKSQIHLCNRISLTFD